MEIVSKTILMQIITQYTGRQDIIKKLASCDPCGRKSGLKTVAFLLRLSILPTTIFNSFHSQATLSAADTTFANSLDQFSVERECPSEPGIVGCATCVTRDANVANQRENSYFAFSLTEQF